MIIILFFALFLNTPFTPSLLKNTSALATVFQQKCVQILPLRSKSRDLLGSLICGQNIKDPELKENLVKTSLIHVFIISGSHLILLDELLGLLRIPVFVRIVFLALYSLIVGWQPPAVRALIALSLRSFLKKLNLNFPADLTVLISGIFTLTLFPAWWDSTSLVMSWSAALALCWVPTLKIRKKISGLLFSHLAVFIFMSVPLWGIGNLHPLSLIYNLFLGPVISFLLLPLAFVSVLIHPLLPVLDEALLLFGQILKLASEPIVTSQSSTLTLQYLWIWVFGWQIFFHFLRLHLYQGKDFSR
jgi:competence protein ComEC